MDSGTVTLHSRAIYLIVICRLIFDCFSYSKDSQDGNPLGVTYMSSRHN